MYSQVLKTRGSLNSWGRSGAEVFSKTDKRGGVGGVNKRGVGNSFCNIDKTRKIFQSIQTNKLNK